MTTNRSDPTPPDRPGAGPLSDVAVLIPAAGRVPESVLALSNISCPAMIPVAGRPVIHWTMSYLRSLGLSRFLVAVPRRGLFVEDFVDCTFGDDCEVGYLVPSRDGGLGLTVFELAERAGGTSALVVLGDTHFQFADPAVLAAGAARGADGTAAGEPFVLVSPVEESYRWCVAESDGDGRVTALRDKEPGLPGPVDALIGAYFFPDLGELRRAARDAVAAADAAGRPAQMAGILERIAAVRPLRAVAAGEWLDCGNPDRQADSHRSLLQKRAFNELSIDPRLGTITKRSRAKEKFLAEIDYLRLLPPDLAVLFPRVVDCSTDWRDPWLTSEYYGYPNLSEVFVFENVDPGIWERVFGHLFEIVTAGFMRHRRPLAEGAVAEMYLGKTRRRLAAMTTPRELAALAAHPGEVTVNGRPLANLPRLWERLEAEVAALAATAEGAVVHGDLCFSNILYDLRSGICKLVDPRGSFGGGGATGIVGDPRYDVAKLYHSVYGLYDFIVHDLFRVSLDGTAIELDVRSRRQHGEILARFERAFFPAFDRREILLVTGLLFASMPALHYDAPKRQIAMYARALELLDEALADPPRSAG